MIVTFPAKHTNTQLGTDIVALSRATSKEKFNIQDYDINGVTAEELKTIIWSKAYDDISNFENLLQA